jgi:hypothetical protein
LSGVEGRVEAGEGELPLVIRAPRGLGQVIFLAADFDVGLLGAWSDRRLLAARLLDLPTREQPTEEAASGAAYGYLDLAGQLRSALDQFPGVRLVPFYVVAMLAAFYILLIGPGDYFFLRRFVRRMEWTWLTFPAIVIVFAAGAYAAAWRLKGHDIRVSQADLVDFDVSGGSGANNAGGGVRGTSWFSVLSPRTETFRMTAEPRQPGGEPARDARATLAWLGMPGDGMGGMYRPWARTAGLSPWSTPYAMLPAAGAVDELPIQVWSTKSLTARWWASSPRRLLDADLTDDEGVPTGTIVSRLKIPLSQCLLAYDRWAYDLGTLDPGASKELTPASRRIELQTLLTGRKLSFDDSGRSQTETATPYDASSRQAAYVLQAMMFFQAAGGRRYVGMANDYQGFVDLSGLLKAGRAVLVAVPAAGSDRRAAELLRDGRPLAGPDAQNVTCYRFVLPVASKK